MNPALDRVLASLARRQPRGGEFPVPGDPDAAALEEELRAAEDETSVALVSFLDVHGLSLSRASDVRQFARMLLDEVEREEERVKAQLRVTREVAAAAGDTGPAARSVRRLENDLEGLRTISTRIFGFVHQPAIRGQELPSLPRCRGCRGQMDRREHFYSAGGFCSRCRRDTDTNHDAPTEGIGGLLALLG